MDSQENQRPALGDDLLDDPRPKVNNVQHHVDDSSRWPPNQFNLFKFYDGNDDPWMARHTIPASTQHPQQRVEGVISMANLPPSFLNYRSGVPSESDTTPILSDSGYGTRSKQSIDGTSVYDGDCHSHDARSLAGYMTDFAPFNTLLSLDVAGQGTEFYEECPNAADWPQSAELQSGAAPHRPHQGRFFCEACNTSVKTQSQLNKHRQRHNKPWKCDMAGCGRLEGFGTLNDLNRHKISVHPDSNVSGKRFRCTEGSCKTKDKIWPRADNFRSHLKRIHAISSKSDAELAKYQCNVPYIPQDISSVGSQMQYNFSQFHTSEMPLWGGPGCTRRDSDELSRPAEMELSEATPLTLEPGNDPLPCDFEKRKAILLDPVVSMVQVRFASCNKSFDNSESEAPLTPAKMENERSHAAHCKNASRTVPENNKALLSIGNSPHTTNGHLSNDKACDSNGSLSKKTDHRVLTPEHDDDDALSETPSTDDVLESTSEAPHSTHCHAQQGGFSSILDKAATLEFLRNIPKDILDKFFNDEMNGVGRETDAIKHHTPCPFPGCKKGFQRKCELKKHLKRHQKPYGCTFSNCGKRFGSKNDWKRHESNQHFQLETWKCHEASNADIRGLCGKIFPRRELFKNHLQSQHNIKEEARVDKELYRCRIGRNGEPRFWCGFCSKIIELKDKDDKAWTERFNHIDNHYSGRENLPQKSIGDWKSIDPDFSDEYLSLSSEESSKEPGNALIRGHKRLVSDDDLSQGAKRKQTSGHQPGLKRTRMVKKTVDEALMWKCCNCTMDSSVVFNVFCVDGCSHQRCQDCPVWKGSPENTSEMAKQ